MTCSAGAPWYFPRYEAHVLNTKAQPILKPLERTFGELSDAAFFPLSQNEALVSDCPYPALTSGLRESHSLGHVAPPPNGVQVNAWGSNPVKALREKINSP